MTVAVLDSSHPHGLDTVTNSQSPANAAKNFTKCQTRLHQSGFLCVQSTSFSKHILFLLEGSDFVCKSEFCKTHSCWDIIQHNSQLVNIKLGFKTVRFMFKFMRVRVVHDFQEHTRFFINNTQIKILS